MMSPVRRPLPWREVVVPWAVSRALAAGVIIAVAVLRPWPGTAPLGFANFDAAWYIRISQVGYGYAAGGQSSYPFFPLLPAVLKAGRALAVPEEVTGVVVSHMAFLVALFGIHRIVGRHFSDRAATLAVWALALFPASLVFSTPYPSAIFLAASVWAFVFAEEGRDVHAAALVAVAALVRPNGIVVAVAIAVAVRSWRRVALVTAPAVLAVAGWMLMLWRWTGDALVFLHAKKSWEEASLLDFASIGQTKPYVHLVLGVAAITAVVLCARRLPVSWTALAALYLVPSFVLGIVGMGRYANECFPVFAAAGLLLSGLPQWLRATGFSASVLGFGALGAAVAAGRVVP